MTGSRMTKDTWNPDYKMFSNKLGKYSGIKLSQINEFLQTNYSHYYTDNYKKDTIRKVKLNNDSYLICKALQKKHKKKCVRRGNA